MKLRHFLPLLLPCLCAQTPADSGTVIRTETRLVLVDTVVADKKGAYVRDLAAKDFKIWEDGKEQKLTSFSFESGAKESEPRYLVLFFDNLTMSVADQARARQAASKFIGKNANPAHLIAVVNFSGSLQVAQNFSADTDLLEAAVQGIRIGASPASGAAGRGPNLGAVARDFAVRDSLGALRGLAKSLATVPGRKTLIWFTAGYRIVPDQMPAVTATIDACNRANVAVYPIDVRGLVSGLAQVAPPRVPRSPFAFGFVQQSGGGQAGGRGGGPSTVGSNNGSGGGRGGSTAPGNSTGTGPGPGTGFGTGAGGNMGGRGGTTWGRGTTNMNIPAPGTIMAGNLPRMGGNPYSIVPKFPEEATPAQEVMYMIAAGTGGFVIVNTNDLQSGLEKIGREQNEYYLLGYTPSESPEGSCHTLRVKVERSGLTPRSRSGYCNAKSKDVLAATPTEKALEAKAAAADAGTIALSLQAPYFFTTSGVARVHVSLDMPASEIRFQRDKNKLRATLNILGIASNTDGSVAARFSDTVHFEFDDKNEAAAFGERLYHYENQFSIAPGKFKLKLVVASGESFGRAETPLTVDPYDGGKLIVSPLAFGFAQSPQASAALLEDRTPLLVENFQVAPASKLVFKVTQKPLVYFEIYEPLLASGTVLPDTAIALQFRVLDAKSGDLKADSGAFRIQLPGAPGNPAIPYAAQIPIANLSPGIYRVEITAWDNTDAKFERSAEFTIE